MMKLSRLVAAGAFLGLAGCGLPGTFLVEPFLAQNYAGDDFQSYLARYYQERARDAAENDVEWRHAGVYARKGAAAGEGAQVGPWDPAAHGLGGDFATYYPDLLSVLQANANVRPEACARAQVMWDWWIEETTEIDQMSAMNAEEAKAAFLKAYEECKGQVAAPPPQDAFAIYFGWDRYDLTAEAQNAIYTIVGEAQKLANPYLSVVGHTDTSGSNAYNEGLAIRRAQTVANALAGQGIPDGSISIDGRGEREPAVQTGDGVREPLNRRAIVTISE